MGPSTDVVSSYMPLEIAGIRENLRTVFAVKLFGLTMYNGSVPDQTRLV